MLTRPFHFPLEPEAPAIYSKASWGGKDMGPAHCGEMCFKGGNPMENGHILSTAVSGALALSQRSS